MAKDELFNNGLIDNTEMGSSIDHLYLRHGVE